MSDPSTKTKKQVFGIFSILVKGEKGLNGCITSTELIDVFVFECSCEQTTLWSRFYRTVCFLFHFYCTTQKLKTSSFLTDRHKVNHSSLKEGRLDVSLLKMKDSSKIFPRVMQAALCPSDRSDVDDVTWRLN